MPGAYDNLPAGAILIGRALRRVHAGLHMMIGVVLLLGAAGTAPAQQLEPRAYAPAPVGVNVFNISYVYSSGGVALDPSVPIENLHARIHIAAPSYGRIFDLLGRQASIVLAAPVAQAYMTGDVVTGDGQDQQRSIDRAGFGDPALRFAVNLIGLPALTRQEFSTRKRVTTLGTSLTVIAPFGQYDRAKLINLGTNRWAFKPELGLSHPHGQWDFEMYAGVWLFTANDDFFGGKVRRQDPMVSTQAHVVYTFKPGLWASLDYTYYAGGSTTIDGLHKHDRQANSRTGVTLSVPLSVQQSLRMVWARGVSTRIGSDFDTMGIAWQWMWF
jgi:hypothetical protein